MQKWGSHIFLSPAYRRAYVEVQKALEVTEKELVEQVPQELRDFFKKNKDPDYVFEAGADEVVDKLSYEAFMVMQMIYRYCWCTREEREEYDKSQMMKRRQHLLKIQEYIQRRINDFLKYDYCCRFEDCFLGDGTFPVFQGIPPAKLREYPKGCTEVLAVLQTLIPGYVERIPKAYIWVMEMSKSKGYQYIFQLEEYDDRLYEENSLSSEALEILADISTRFWQGYQVSIEEIPVNLNMIEYE